MASTYGACATGAQAIDVARSRILINTLSLTQGGGGRSYLVNILRELARDPRDLEVAVLANAAQLSPEDAGGLELLPVRLPELGDSARLALRVAYEQSVLPARALRTCAVLIAESIPPRVTFARSFSPPTSAVVCEQ